MTICFQSRADGADAPIHHVGRRDDIASGLSLDQRLAHEHFERFVICDIVVDQKTVMAVAGVGIERHVAENADLRNCLLDRPHGAADQIAGVRGFAAILDRERRVGVGKERDDRNAELGRFFGSIDREIDGQADRRPAWMELARASSRHR